MKQNSRRPRFFGRFPTGSRPTEGSVRFRPALRLLEDRCLPSTSLPGGASPIAQTVGGQFGDFWYERASGATIGHVAADGTFAEYSVAGSTPQDIETDVYGNLWTVDPTNGITLNQVTPAGNVLTVTDPPSVASVNALGVPPDSFLPHLLFNANGTADVVVVDQSGDVSLVSAPMTTDTSALRNAWGPVPVVAQATGSLGQDTVLWYPDGSGIDRLSYDGTVQRFSLAAGDTDVVAALGVGPDQNLWFIEARQDSSTGVFYADKIGEMFSNGTMVESSLGSQDNHLQVSGFVPAADGSSLWFDQVSLADDGGVQTGSNVIGQVNFDKTISYVASPAGSASLSATAIGADGSVWSSTSTFDGSQYQTVITQTSRTAFISSSYGDTINLGDSPPIAGNLNLATNQDTSVTGQLPVTPTTGNTLQFSIQQLPDDGTVVINNDGSFSYTPNGGYTGPDSFNYTADDGQGGVAVGTVSVTVNAVNHAPLASDANEIVYINTPVDDVLPVSDIDGNPLQVTITSGPTNGTVNVYGGQGAPGGLGDIRFTYTPNTGYIGPDSFTYQADDGQGDTASGTITFTPYSNQPPTAQDASVTTYLDNAISGRLPAFDPNGTFLTPSIVSQPAHGAVSLPVPGRPGDYGDTSFTYVPEPGYVGTDSFTYQVDDGNGGTATATVSVTVLPLQGTSDVYVDTHWANLTYGTPVANPDPLNPDAPTAIFGYNAFASIDSAIAEAAAIFAPDPSAGVVVVNGANGDAGSGIFNEDVVDDSAVPVYLQQGPVTINSLTGNSAATIALHGVNLNTGGDGANTEYDGTLTGGGALVEAGTGTLTLAGTNTYTGGTTISTGAALQLGNGSATGTIAGNVSDNGSLVFDQPSGSSTFGGVISGSGALTQAGSGTLTLSASNSYSGGTNVQAGTLQVAADADLGTGNVTGAAGSTVEFTGTTTTAKSFAMNGGALVADAGKTITFNGSLVTSATLDGGGTFATSASSGGQFYNIVTTPSVAIVSDNENDKFVNMDNSGAFSLAPGVNLTGDFNTTNLNGFTNESTGSVTIGDGSQLNVANFQSYGTVTLVPATDGNFTELTNLGTSPLGFNGGSQTFVGSASAPNPNSSGINLGGKNMVVSDGLFVNNGSVGSSVGGSAIYVEYNALYKGAGTTYVSITTENGGQVQFGNCPGTGFISHLAFGPGGVSNYVFDIDDAAGAAGPTPDAAGHVDGWSLADTDNFTWTADVNNALTVDLQTLLNPSTVGTEDSGAMDNFDPSQSYVWTAVHWTGTYTGPTEVAALNAATDFDTSGVVNQFGGKFSWKLDTAAQTLSLVYTPPPAVAAVQLNDSGSGVQSMTVTFSAAVNFAGGNAAAAFQLMNLDTGAAADLTATVAMNSSGLTVVTLAFDGGLSTGHYQLGILSDAVTGSDGTALDGSGTGTTNGINYVGPIWTIG